MWLYPANAGFSFSCNSFIHSFMRLSVTGQPETHVSGVSDTHLLTIGGATAIGVGVAGGTTLLGAVAPVVLGVGVGVGAAAAYYRHARFMDGLTDEQMVARESLLDSARKLGSK